MCIGAYVHICLLMCAYRCLCIRIWLYDMLKRRNLDNYAPVFTTINNVCRSLLAKLVIFLISLAKWSRIGWLYVDGCNHALAWFSYYEFKSHYHSKYVTMRTALHILIITFHTFNPKTWHVEIYLIICEIFSLKWYEQLVTGID